MELLLLLLLPVLSYLSYRLSHNEEFVKKCDEFLSRLNRGILKLLNPRYKHPYSLFNPNYYKRFGINHTVTARTVFNFKVEYELYLSCRRENDEEFERTQMLEEHSRQELASEYNKEVVVPFLRDNCYVFYLRSRPPSLGDRFFEVLEASIGAFMEENGDSILRYTPDTLISAREFATLDRNGCEVTLSRFSRARLSDKLIEENYSMLSDEEKETVEAHPEYTALTEMIAVAALKRQLDLFGRETNQKHETDVFAIDTERVGQRVKIRWRFKSKTAAPYELLGFRNASGFFMDALDEERNGTLVVHSYEDGETVERLIEGESNFYTFFVREQEKREDGSKWKGSPLRFQVTLSSNEEREALEATLRWLEEKRASDPTKEKLSQALKEIGLYVEVQNAVDARGKSEEAKIMASDDPEEVKQEKIKRLRAVIKEVRDRAEE